MFKLHALVGPLLCGCLCIAACSEETQRSSKDAAASDLDASSGPDAPSTDGPMGGDGPPADSSTSMDVAVSEGGLPPDGAPGPVSVTVTLDREAGASGSQRLNFALPLAPGQLTTVDRLKVLVAGKSTARYAKGLAKHGDGSLRSVQIQLEVAQAVSSLEVRLGEPYGSGPLSAVAVSATLQNDLPRVWAVLPANWLAQSGVVGPTLTKAAIRGGALDAWGLCDYAKYDSARFDSEKGSAGPWLYDRVTTLYRGYAQSGDAAILRSAYVEAQIYRGGITGSGSSARIGVPGKSSDLKYHYSQGLALHYLLTGDERFRERAEDVAQRTSDLWKSPGYAGGSDFWTERHAGFALLNYVWAEIITDDKAALFGGLADTAVTAYLQVQSTYPAGYASTTDRCFAHSAAAHGEGYGYFGCSPWMSAILADGLDAYARERSGAQRSAARESLVELGRAVAFAGLDSGGKPYYWMGIGGTQNQSDSYNEHWGESAYVVAMAWHFDGRKNAQLEQIAKALVAGLKSKGSAPHIRSFNWQCRSAVLTPWYLK